MKEKVLVVLALVVACVVVGVVMGSIDVAQALAPVGEVLGEVGYHLNQIQ